MTKLIAIPLTILLASTVTAQTPLTPYSYETAEEYLQRQESNRLYLQEELYQREREESTQRAIERSRQIIQQQRQEMLLEEQNQRLKNLELLNR